MFILSPEDVLKIVLAVVIGGIIGIERELDSKAAGLRTVALITIGATLYTIISMKFGDADRVAANIVSGVGFLGAGVILFSEGKVKGLTTASSIWTAAAIGMAIGKGQYLLAFATALLVVVVLELFERLNYRVYLRRRDERRTYEVVYASRAGKHEEITRLFQTCNLRVRVVKRFKDANLLSGTWDAEGRAEAHAQLTAKLLADKEVKELHY